MRRARAAGQFFAPVPGLHIPIPSEHSAWGVVPAMDFLGRSYYVGLLSAAELHGVAHQRPQVFQVMVHRSVADRDIERVRLRFYDRGDLDRAAVVLRNSRTAHVRVATPEVTVLDPAARPKDSGSLHNVATIVGELAEEGKLDGSSLADLATQYPLAVARRLGWLLERVASTSIQPRSLTPCTILSSRSRVRDVGRSTCLQLGDRVAARRIPGGDWSRTPTWSRTRDPARCDPGIGYDSTMADVGRGGAGPGPREAHTS